MSHCAPQATLKPKRFEFTPKTVAIKSVRGAPGISRLFGAAKCSQPRSPITHTRYTAVTAWRLSHSKSATSWQISRPHPVYKPE